MRHPEHDRLVGDVYSWYTQSAPAMGYEVERGRFGFYSRNTKAPEATPEVTLRDITPEDVPALLADLHGRFGHRPVDLLVDDPAADAALGPALVAAGCRREGATTHLAHVGPISSPPAVAGLTVEPAGTHNLAAWVTTKLRAFANSEEEPDLAAVRAGLELRRAEMAGQGRFFLAHIEREPAAILGLYDGPDRFIFVVGTRIPFRHRGIARSLLCTALAGAYARGCRSVLINADPDDTPVHFYRRIGFADEVYWQRRYSAGAKGA